MMGLTQEECDDAGIYEDTATTPVSNAASRPNSDNKPPVVSSPPERTLSFSNFEGSGNYDDDDFDNYEADENNPSVSNSPNAANSPPVEQSTANSPQEVAVARSNQLALLKSKQRKKTSKVLTRGNQNDDSKDTNEEKSNPRNPSNQKQTSQQSSAHGTTTAESMKLSPSELALFGIKDGQDALQAIAVAAPSDRKPVGSKKNVKSSGYGMKKQTVNPRSDKHTAIAPTKVKEKSRSYNNTERKTKPQSQDNQTKDKKGLSRPNHPKIPNLPISDNAGSNNRANAGAGAGAGAGASAGANSNTAIDATNGFASARSDGDGEDLFPSSSRPDLEVNHHNLEEIYDQNDFENDDSDPNPYDNDYENKPVVSNLIRKEKANSHFSRREASHKPTKHDFVGPAGQVLHGSQNQYSPRVSLDQVRSHKIDTGRRSVQSDQDHGQRASQYKKPRPTPAVYPTKKYHYYKAPNDHAVATEGQLRKIGTSYDDKTGLFSTYETEAVRESRKETYIINNLERKLKELEEQEQIRQRVNQRAQQERQKEMEKEKRRKLLIAKKQQENYLAQQQLFVMQQRGMASNAAGVHRPLLHDNPNAQEDESQFNTEEYDDYNEEYPYEKEQQWRGEAYMNCPEIEYQSEDDANVENVDDQPAFQSRRQRQMQVRKQRHDENVARNKARVQEQRRLARLRRDEMDAQKERLKQEAAAAAAVKKIRDQERANGKYLQEKAAVNSAISHTALLRFKKEHVLSEKYDVPGKKGRKNNGNKPTAQHINKQVLYDSDVQYQNQDGHQMQSPNEGCVNSTSPETQDVDVPRGPSPEQDIYGVAPNAHVGENSTHSAVSALLPASTSHVESFIMGEEEEPNAGYVGTQSNNDQQSHLYRDVNTIKHYVPVHEKRGGDYNRTSDTKPKIPKKPIGGKPSVVGGRSGKGIPITQRTPVAVKQHQQQQQQHLVSMQALEKLHQTSPNYHEPANAEKNLSSDPMNNFYGEVSGNRYNHDGTIIDKGQGASTVAIDIHEDGSVIISNSSKDAVQASSVVDENKYTNLNDENQGKENNTNAGVEIKQPKPLHDYETMTAYNSMVDYEIPNVSEYQSDGSKKGHELGPMDERPDSVLNGPTDTFGIPLLGMSNFDGGNSLDQYSSVQVTDWGADFDDEDVGWNENVAAGAVGAAAAAALSPISQGEDELESSRGVSGNTGEKSRDVIEEKQQQQMVDKDPEESLHLSGTYESGIGGVE